MAIATIDPATGKLVGNDAAEQASGFGVELLLKPFTLTALLAAVERGSAAPLGQEPP